MTEKELISGILAREGSLFTDLPSDKGGPTRYGITVNTLSAYRGRPATRADVQRLTEEDARAIYAKQYITAYGFDRIPNEALRVFLVDFGVTSGQARAIRWLQRALGFVETKVSGVLDAATITATAQADPRLLLGLLVAFRVYTAHRTSEEDHSQRVFAAGWLNRTFGFLPFNAGYLDTHGGQL